MIHYLDASALVKRYVVEAGTELIFEAFTQAEVPGTTIISRSETAPVLIWKENMGNAVVLVTFNHHL